MNFTRSLIGAVFAALGASLCCVAPLVLVMLGLGGAWLAGLTRLEPLRLPLSIATLGLLAYSGYQLFRPRPFCAPGQACAAPEVRRRQRVVFALAVIPLLALLSFPYFAFLFY
jgi:mercuric ion transport protein